MPLKFLRENIFYTPEQKQEINNSLFQNYGGGTPPANYTVSGGTPPANYTVNGVEYDGRTGQALNSEGSVSNGGYAIGPNSERTDFKPGDTRPVTPPLVTPPAVGPPQPTDRTNPNGIVQRGVSLSSANDLLGGFGIGEVRDLSTMYKSNALPTTSSNDAQVMGMPKDQADTIERGGTLETLIDASGIGQTSGMTTGRTDSPQEGASPAPDTSDQQRQVVQGVNGTEFGGEGPDNSSLVSPMYANENRNRIRSAFLDTSKNSMQALRASEREAGIFQQGGRTYGNVDGELREVTGDSYAFRDAAMSGKNPLEAVPNAFGDAENAGGGTDFSAEDAQVMGMSEEDSKKIAAGEFLTTYIGNNS